MPFLSGIGFWEILIILGIILLIFGPKKLPQLSKSIGESIREFKKASSEVSDKSEDQAKA